MVSAVLLERRRSRSGSSRAGGVFGRGLIAQAAVGMVVVVGVPPLGAQRLGLRHILENFRVQQLASQAAVEALCVDVLPRRPWLDV